MMMLIKGVKNGWNKGKRFFGYAAIGGIMAFLPLTLKAHPHFPKVKLPYEQVDPYYFGLREHEAGQAMNRGDRVNVNIRKGEVKGDSLIKEWERTYDYPSDNLPYGLDKDEFNNISSGMGDNITNSYIIRVNPINGDTITVIARARTPPGTQAGNTYLAQVLTGKDDRQIMVGLDWNDAEHRNNLWIGSYSSNGDSLWFKFYNRDSTSSEFFLMQKPAAVFSDGSIVVSTRSNIYSSSGGSAYNSWEFAVDTLGNILWTSNRIDTTIEKNVPGSFDDLLIKDDTLIEVGSYYSTVTYEADSKFYKVDKNGNTITKKYFNLGYDEAPKSVAFTDNNRLFVSGYFDASNGSGYYTPFLAELNPQTLDTLWLKTYEGGIYRDERVEDMTIAGNYVFLAGYINADTDTAAIWMTDKDGSFIREIDRPNAIYTGVTSISDSIVFAYGRDEDTLRPLLVKYRIDNSGIDEKPVVNRTNTIKLKVLSNPSPAPLVEVNKIINNKVDVYNLAGQKVRSYFLNNGKAQIKGLKTGIYFIRYGKNKEKVVVIK